MHSDNPRGTRCQALATNGGQWCYMHDPARAGERHRNATRGGRSGSRGRPQSELSKLRDENAAIRDRLLEGDLQPGVAAVAIQSLNCDVRVVLAILKAKPQYGQAIRSPAEVLGGSWSCVPHPPHHTGCFTVTTPILQIAAPRSL
jgi:hypothetical protein